MAMNRTIFEGDNLDVMRGLNSESVDLIYLDPPFNSNKNYSAPIGSEAAGAAFKDTWTLDDVDEAEHGELAEKSPALYSVIQAARETHGKSMQSYLIMMSLRLIEMKRILKDTGSIYLHCDPTASHYLKLVMDCIFNTSNFRNEIVWQRISSHNDAKRWGKIHDILLFYSKTSDFTWISSFFIPYKKEYLDQAYRNKDERGRYTTSPLQARSLSGGGYEYEWKGRVDIWKFPLERMEQLEAEGLIHWPKKANGIPRRKVYLDPNKGTSVQDTITDIQALHNSSAERIGYPTQKPLALLERIVRASSNRGDMILDPFCGCATTCIAAEKLERQWIGIDLSGMAVKLVHERLDKDVIIGEFSLIGDVIHRTDIPRRSDIESHPNYRTHKHTLYGKQEGKCNGCRILFPFQNLTVDHIVPRSKGGQDHLDNLQLLCDYCNSLKGNRPQAYLIAELKTRNYGE